MTKYVIAILISADGSALDNWKQEEIINYISIFRKNNFKSLLSSIKQILIFPFLKYAKKYSPMYL